MVVNFVIVIIKAKWASAPSFLCICQSDRQAKRKKKHEGGEENWREEKRQALQASAESKPVFFFQIFESIFSPESLLNHLYRLCHSLPLMCWKLSFEFNPTITMWKKKKSHKHQFTSIFSGSWVCCYVFMNWWSGGTSACWGLSLIKHL